MEMSIYLKNAEHLLDQVKNYGRKLMKASTSSRWTLVCGASSIITVLIVLLAPWGKTNDTENLTGCLTANTMFPLIYNGRNVGFAEIPAGTPVRIHHMGETTTTVEAHIGTTEIPKENVEITGESLPFEQERKQAAEKQELAEILSVPRSQYAPTQTNISTQNKPTSLEDKNKPDAEEGVPTGNEDIPSSNPSFEREVLELTNLARAEEGLPPLIWDENLARAARFHSFHMSQNKYFAHDTLIKASPRFKRISRRITWKERMKLFNVDASGENVAITQKGPQKVINAWMNSSGHRKNILRPSTTRLGVGYVNGHWTQDFGS